MKLKNKRTGEIIIGYGINRELETYDSIRKFCEEWEDYEEPKIYFYLSSNGTVYESDKPYCEEAIDEIRKQLGNYFETKEEAEKAVEKLKAWKRLKDMGFKFMWWKEANGMLDSNKIAFNHFVYNTDYKDQVRQDLDLLFGGEE